MNALDPIAEIQQKLAAKVTVAQLSPHEQDLWLNHIRTIGVHEKLIGRLAEHYGVPYKGLMDLCLSRQLAFLHLMTDYTKDDSEATLHDALRSQQSATETLITNLNSRISQLDEVIRHTEFLRDQAAQVLAMYKARYLGEGAQTKPDQLTVV